MTRENKPLIVYGKHPFEKEEEDEIEFQTGDPILVLEKDEEFNDGWWKGRTLSGEEGLFPVNFTTTENIFNVNISKFFDSTHSYVPNIIEDDFSNQPLVSPFGTFNNSLSLNNSEDGIHNKSPTKSVESSNSSGFDNRPSSPDGSVSSMRALSSPRMSASLPNNFRMMGGDLDRNESSSSKYKNNFYSSSQPISHSQTTSISQGHSQSQQSINSVSKSAPVQSQYRKPQDWTVEEVCEWLMSVEYDGIIPAIKENNVNGEKLLELNLSKLREYGLHSLSDRIELLHEILTLREEYAESRPVFSHSGNTSFTSDYESISSSVKYDKGDNKLHKPSSNFSISEYYDKSSDNGVGEEEEGKKIVKSNSSSSEGAVAYQSSGSEKRHHELPVTPNIYKPSDVGNTSMSSNYGGGMVGMNGINMSHRNRSLSLQGEGNQNGPIPAGQQIPRSVSVSTADRLSKISNGTNLDFKNAERKSWLLVRFDDEVGWKKRWVVLIDNKFYILQSPDNHISNSVSALEPKILLTLELDPTYKVLPDINDTSMQHNFLLQSPRLGGIHLAAEDQLGVVTWINVLVRACNNTIRKPLPLIPLKNTGRQNKELIINTSTLSTVTFENKTNYPTIYEDQAMDFAGPRRKNSVNMSINGILSPNLESEYAYSVKNDEESFLMDKNSMYHKNRSNSIISNTFPANPIGPISPMSPISPTQSAAAAANGWYRTNAKSATDYSNYRNLQQVSQETRMKLQKTAKLTEPPVMTPILKANKVKSFNPNKIDENDEFSLNENSMMSFLSSKNDMSKKSFMGGMSSMNSMNSMNSINGLGSPILNKHSSVTSSYIGGYNNFNNFGSSQVSPIEMMERRGIGSFITNNSTKVSKKNKIHNFIFK
ncbi:hypothetical protein PIROE2DRAFT_11409 [Piromyces sp. E2]|nr:hypothetical protein PIROE2DRAFT_11409 [Piromyces sp. E2]|eukprot:OUM62352.1 hypothetical protein PIROE2DRAFT_11409 [Piromyces sp. E2]